MSGAPAAIEDMPQGTHEATLGDWLSTAAGRFQAAGIDSARLDARLLASFVLGWDQARVLAIQHARDNTESYGRRYSQQELVWEVPSAEEGEDYY